MFSRPRHGWTTVNFNGIDFMAASYVTDVPIDTMDELTLALTDPSHKLNLTFDNEPEAFGFVEFAEEVLCVRYDFDECNMIPFDKFFHLPFKLAKDFVLATAKEVVEDIETYFEEWVFWVDSEFEMTKQDIDDRKALLKEKSCSLQNAIKIAEHQSTK